MYMWGFPKLGVPFWGPYNGDFGRFGSMLESPILGNYHVSNPLSPALLKIRESVSSLLLLSISSCIANRNNKDNILMISNY